MTAEDKVAHASIRQRIVSQTRQGQNINTKDGTKNKV
jgi:hypothetical protein